MARLFWFTIFPSYQIDSKEQGVDGRSCHDWTKSCSHWSQVYIYLNSQYMEVFLVAMSSHYHPQQLLSTKQKCWYKKDVQNCQSSSEHFLDLGVRVLNIKEVYLAHILVFLSDSKNILLLKGLLTNHIKSFKEFSCVRNLMMKKDYKSSRWTPNFSYVTSNDHNLVNFYHLEPTLIPQWSWGCELYSFFYMQSDKMDGRCLKDTKNYRSLHDFFFNFNNS